MNNTVNKKHITKARVNTINKAVAFRCLITNKSIMDVIWGQKFTNGKSRVQVSKVLRTLSSIGKRESIAALLKFLAINTRAQLFEEQ